MDTEDVDVDFTVRKLKLRKVGDTSNMSLFLVIFCERIYRNGKFCSIYFHVLWRFFITFWEPIEERLKCYLQLPG